MDVRVGPWRCWVLNNWCFCIEVLKETLESSLDYKEIKSVNSKGNQSWIFNGGTDAEAEVPILWPPDEKSQLIGKDSDAGKDWRQEEKGMTKDEMVGWHHQLNVHKFEQTQDSEGQGSLACCSPRDHRIGHDLATELQWVCSFRRDSPDTSLFPYQVHLSIGTTSQNAKSFVSSWAQRNESHLLSDINDQGHIKFSSEYWWIATLWQWLSFMLFAFPLFPLFSLFR